MPVGFGVGIDGLRQLNRDLKKAGDAMGPMVKAATKRGADLVRDRAKTNFSWSSRIPSSVKLSATMKGAKVTAGGKKAPHAAAYEHEGKPGEFRHPVFGQDVWVSQTARPSLGPALSSMADRVFEEVVKGLDDAFKGAL